MNYGTYFKKVGLSFLWMMIILFVATFLLTTLNYFDLVTGKFFDFFKLIIPLVAMIFGGIFFGKHSQKKGWLEGFKLSVLFIIFLTLLNLVFMRQGFELKLIIYDVILMISTIFGSMIGINLKHTK